MSLTSLRRAKPIESDSIDLFTDLPENNVRLLSIEYQKATPLCEEYPYERQSIYYGELEYDESSNYGHDRTISIRFKFRLDSNLFILSTEVDFKIGDLITELNSLSSDRFRIYRGLIPNRQQLWGFFRNSDGLIEMTIINEEGKEVEVGTIEESVAGISGEYPIESATAIFEFDNQNIVVRYTNGSINIDSKDPEANEYIIQLFERDVISRNTE